MLREQINTIMKEAMLAKETEKLGTVRMIMATLKDKDIAARGNGKDPLADDEILSMMQGMIKQRKESIEVYKKGNREDLVQKEKAEIAVISSFLPEQMDESAVKAAIDETIKQTGAVSVKDMGKVMGVLKAKYTGQMDFGTASTLIKSSLG